MTAKYDDLRYLVLKRILSLPEPLTFFDLGYLCGPNTIRTMAANGLIDVKITIKQKGREAFEKEVAIRKKRERKAQRQKHVDKSACADFVKMAPRNGLDGLPRNTSEAA